MKVCIQQPQYLPYIGFFHKLMHSDVCVILDDVEYSKNDLFNRNKIKTSQEWCWLTVPVKANMKQLIKDVKINNSSNWKKKHSMAIQSNYQKAAFFNTYWDFFEKYYSKEWDTLTELNMESLKYLAKVLDIPIKFVMSSELNITTSKTQRLIDICKKVGADTYVSGTGAKDYMNDKLFEKENIKLLYQDFNHPVYNQQFGEFEKFMSIIDLLFNHGEESSNIIRQAGGVV